MQRLYPCFLFLFVLSLPFLSVHAAIDGVTVTQTGPSAAAPGTDFIVEVTISKGGISGFAKYQSELPDGLVAKESDSKGASFTFMDQKVKFIWMSLPSDGDVKISYKVMVPSTYTGNAVINGTFSYVEKNETQKAKANSFTVAIEANGGNSKAPAPLVQPTKIIVESALPNAAPAQVVYLGNEGVAQNANEAGSGSGVTNKLPESVPVSEVDPNAKEVSRTPYAGTPVKPDVSPAPIPVPVAKEETPKPTPTPVVKEETPAPVPVPVAKEEVPAPVVKTETPPPAAKEEPVIAEVKPVSSPAQEAKPIETPKPAAVEVTKESSVMAVLPVTPATIAEAGGAPPAETPAPAVVSVINSKGSSKVTKADIVAANKAEEPAKPVVAEKPVEKPVKPAPVKLTPAEKPAVKSSSGSITFRVQLGATNSESGKDSLKTKLGISQNMYSEQVGGLYKHTAGDFKTYAEARDLKNELKAKGAQGPFIVAFKNGAQMNVQEALKETNQKWVP